MLSEVTVSTLPGRRHETSTIADGSTVVLALTRVALRSGHHCPRIGDARRVLRAGRRLPALPLVSAGRLLCECPANRHGSRSDFASVPNLR